MVELWELHLKAELVDKDASASCDTMVAHAYVNHVPVLTGGAGRQACSTSTAATSSPASRPTWSRFRSRGPSVRTASSTS